ncbi:adenosylcobinamide-GDP ribazoletransferase [Sulfurisphaera javensis]|uniref:Adenosylcobinamide-GDP ribazoletransferase n=1 Tax=Sulfurisphaera javensis TaxID=2049879 RepID=A0AAT9GPK2_9CREN
MKVFKEIASQISFFTIIPSVKATLEETANMAFISPILVGLVTALIDYTVLYVSIKVLGNYGFILLIPTVEIIRGFHHLDGLLDFGDALMTKDYNKRLKALHDVEVGAGGIGLFLVYLSLFLSVILSMKNLSFFPLLIAEVESRGLGILILSIMKPMEGSYMGRVFHERLNNKWKIISLLIQIALIGNILVIISFLFLFLLFYFLGYKTLKGSSGDLVGAIITLSFPLFLLIAERSCYPFFISLFYLIF